MDYVTKKRFGGFLVKLLIFIALGEDRRARRNLYSGDFSLGILRVLAIFGKTRLKKRRNTRKRN
jgi:hypothetical protein